MFLLDWGKLKGRFDSDYYALIKSIKLNESKRHIQVKKLFYIKDGDHSKFPEEEKTESQNGVRYLRSQDIKDNKIISDNPVYVSKKYYKTIKRSHIAPNDIVFSIMATLGSVATIPKDFEPSTANRAVGILTRKSEEIIQDYFTAFFSVDYGIKLLETLKRGGIQQRINLQDIGNLYIPIPKLIEQRKIVDKWDSIKFEKYQKEFKAQGLLSSIEDFFLSALGITVPPEPENKLVNRIFNADFTETLGNRLDPFYYQEYFEQLEEAIINCKYNKNVTKLRNCLSFIESGSRPQGGVKNIEEGILSFGGEHVNWSGQIEVKTPKFIPEKYHKNHRLTHTKLNDVLIVKDGATTGKIGIIIENEHVDQNINEHVFMLRFNNLNPYFATFLLNTNFYQKVIKRQITGATVTGLTKQAFKSILIPVPDMDTQIELVNIIKAKREEAFNLLVYAENDFNEAKKEVEKMILE